MKNLLLICLSLAVTVSCSTNQHKAKKLDTSIEGAEKMGRNQNIGVKNGDMIYQKKVNMSEELRTLQYSVYETEDKVYGNRKFGSEGMYGILKQCKLKLASPKNGGDGKLKWMEPIDRVTDKEEHFEIGLNDEKKIIGLNEEYLKDRIKRFRGYKKILEKRQDEYQEKIDICNSELNAKTS